jgi:hypothetical protein
MKALAETARFWVPMVAGVLCMVAGLFVGVIAAWVLLMLGFFLLLDGVTAMWERAGGTGNLTTYRQ